MYWINVTLHVLAAIIWLGGMFFFALVGAPVLRRVEPAAVRADLFTGFGRRFRKVGSAALAVLIVTGVANLHFRGLLHSHVLGSAAFWRTPYGGSLAWKLGSVIVMMGAGAAHDVLAVRSGRTAPGSHEADRLRRRGSLLARIAAIAGLVAVVAAVRLARGG